MISGIGIDITELARFRRSLDEGGDRFLRKVYTPGELAYSNAKVNRHQHLAVRFSAKEALSKAVSTGWAGAFRWQDVEVVNEPSGQPRIVLHGELARLLEGYSIHVSLSHSETTVVAVVVIENPSQPG